MTTVETRHQEAVLTAIENIVVPGVELAMKSDKASSGRSLDGNVLEPDHRDFSGKVEGLQMTTSSRVNSHTDLGNIHQTRGNYTVEGGDLLVIERNVERQTYTHHSMS